MKRIVWENKSNGQLCVTIPKNSGIKDGDIVTLEKNKIKRLVYTPVTGDLFHYGHLRVLQSANDQGDFHVCGVLSDEAIQTYKDKPIAHLKERKAIISSLRCVDMVVTQNSMNPTEILKELNKKFPEAKIILVYGSNWDKVPGKKFIQKIDGEIFQPEFYNKLSKEKIAKKILNRR